MFASYLAGRIKIPLGFLLRSEDGQGKSFWSTHLKLSLHQKTEPEISSAALPHSVCHQQHFQGFIVCGQFTYSSAGSWVKGEWGLNPFVPLWSCYAYFPVIEIDSKLRRKTKSKEPQKSKLPTNSLNLGKKIRYIRLSCDSYSLQHSLRKAFVDSGSCSSVQPSLDYGYIQLLSVEKFPEVVHLLCCLFS